jgi:hypothetical protein
VNQSDEADEGQRVWKVLSEAGLVEIRLEEFADRLGDVKHLVITRLQELLGFDKRSQECESAAHSLGTLKGLELKLQSTAPAPPPKRSQD